MGVINKSIDEINTLLDKVANLPEEGTGGKDGKTPVLETGTTTTLEAGTQATSEVVRDGEDSSGNPKYIINFGIPRGQDGISGGGVADSVEWSNVLNKPTWVTSSTKPSYTASEVGAIPKGGLKTINGQSLEGEGNIEISGSGSGIPDAPADNEIYGRKNNNWEKIVASGMQIFDAVELAELVDAGESDLSPTLKEAIASAYENKTVFADVGGDIYSLIIAAKSEGYELVIQRNFPYPYGGLYNTSVQADINTTTNKITVTAKMMILPSHDQVPDEAPADGKTYGRNNKQWIEIASSGGGGGSVQVVDISKIYEKYMSAGLGQASGTMTREDYDILESYANNKDIICVSKSMVDGFIVAFINLLADSSNLYLFFYDLFFASNPTPNVILVSKSDLTYTSLRHAVLTTETIAARNFSILEKYTKSETYTPITTADSVLEAIGKLEAGVSQGGGGSSAYYISSDIFNLNADSTSEEISQVVGGVEGMQAMIQAVKDGKRLVARAVTPDSVGNIVNADLILGTYRDTESDCTIGFTAILYIVFGLIMPSYFIQYNKTTQKFSINYVDINQEHLNQ